MATPNELCRDSFLAHSCSNLICDSLHPSTAVLNFVRLIVTAFDQNHLIGRQLNPENR